MATALNPTRWDSGVSPAGAGLVSISWTDSSTTFRATANSGWKFDHWVFTPYGGQWMPQVQEDFSKNLNNATHVSGRYRFDPDVNPQYADAGVMGTAYFVPDTPGPDTVTITIVARNGWGHVQFEGETPTTGTASKTVPIGTRVAMEAIESGAAHFSSWSGPGTGTTSKRLVRVVRTDETWTANFYYLCAAKVAQIADWTTTSPVGEVRAVDVDGATTWGNDVSRWINHGTEFSVEQRESLQGWHFVKWRYRTISRTIGDWQETSETVLNFQYMINLEAIALFQRTPTHLLVNSSDRTTPVQLVYDPATNKLVADY